MITSIKTILRDTASTPFAIIEGTLALAQLRDRPTAMPAAYVAPIGASSDENQRMNGVLQMTETQVAVLIIFENLSTPLGEAAADELETLIKWVRDELVGVVLAEKYRAIEHVSGELVKIKDGVVWWQETFSVAHFQVEKPT